MRSKIRILIRIKEELNLDPHQSEKRDPDRIKVMQICNPVLYSEFVWSPCQQLHGANVDAHSISFSCLSLFILGC
jgi:hypothetical protein